MVDGRGGLASEWRLTGAKCPPFQIAPFLGENGLAGEKAFQSIMLWRSLIGLRWRLTFQHAICVLGDLGDPLGLCDLPIPFPHDSFFYIFYVSALPCFSLSLEAIHCVDIDLFFLLFGRHHYPVVFLVYLICEGHIKMLVCDVVL